MEKKYCIVSKDRHRDDRVYIFTGTVEQVKAKCEEVWKEDFSFEYSYPWSDGSGSYSVDYSEAIELN